MFRMNEHDLSLLTGKEKLGYSFESRVQQLLWFKFRIPFAGNPLSPLLWKHCVGKGVDIETDNLALELKFVQHTVYPCHVKNHVIPRFEGIEGKRKVALTNDKRLWSRDAVSILSRYDVKLWDVGDLISYYSIPSFTSVYNYISRDIGYGHPTTLYNARYNARYSNAILNAIDNAVNEENAVGDYAQNSGTIGENSTESGEEEGKGMDSIDEPRRNEASNVKEYYGRACFRCGKLFKKGTSPSKFFCPDCVDKATEKDKRTTLWYSTAESHSKRFGTQITCKHCGKPISVLEKIETVGQYYRHFYHSSCWERLVGMEDSEPKETISFIIVNSDGSRRETFEVV